MSDLPIIIGLSVGGIGLAIGLLYGAQHEIKSVNAEWRLEILLDAAKKAYREAEKGSDARSTLFHGLWRLGYMDKCDCESSQP